MERRVDAIGRAILKGVLTLAYNQHNMVKQKRFFNRSKHHMLHLVEERPGRSLFIILIVLAIVMPSTAFVGEHTVLAGRISNIESKDWLIISVTWWAGLAAVWLGYLTYSQRQQSKLDVNLAQQNLDVAYTQLGKSLMPYLEIRPGRPDTNFNSIEVRNIGYAIATGIRIDPITYTCNENKVIALNYESINAVAPDGEWIAINPLNNDKLPPGVEARHALLASNSNIVVNYRGLGRYDREKWEYQAEFVPLPQGDEVTNGLLAEVAQGRVGLG